MLKKQKMKIVVVLDNIRSMHNIGAIFRTCDALGNTSIYLCGICATPPNKDIHKTALGSTESVNWRYFNNTKNAIENLIDNKYHIIVIEQTPKSVSLENFHTNSKKIALIFGNEIKGVSQTCIDRSDSIIKINQYGIKKSMNVSVVAGIILWAIRTKSKTN